MDRENCLGRRGCLDFWTKENNSIITKWKSVQRVQKGNHQKDLLKQCYSEIGKLLQKIQGLPSVAATLSLELTVLYNTLLFSFGLSDHGGAGRGELLTLGLVRALEALDSEPQSSDPLDLWRAVLQISGSQEWIVCFHQLACLQWAEWLSASQLEKIRELAVLLADSRTEAFSPPADTLMAVRNISLSIEENPSLSVALSAGDLRELLCICTVVTQGAEMMEAGEVSAALLNFQEAAALPCPRSVLAQVHTLMGLCLRQLGRPQSALQCYRKALEIDFGCLSALYQSSLVFRQLAVAQAEMEALRLLHSAVVCSAQKESCCNWIHLITHESLLCSPSLISTFKTPAVLGVKHSLAQSNLRYGRISEAVEQYLDLLTSFHNDEQLVTTDSSPALPRIPEIYLEAAVSLLKAKRYWDVVAVCEEVVAKTVDLIPQRLTLDLSQKELQETSAAFLVPSLCGKQFRKDTEGKKESLNCALWAATAFFFQGQAFTWLKESKESISNYTRCINIVIKVPVEHTGPDLCEETLTSIMALRRLKALAFAGRGVSFMARQQGKEALLNFQLSLQATPGCEETELWLTEALWSLGRREEAVAFWSKHQSSTREETVEEVPQRALPLYLMSSVGEMETVDAEEMRRRMRECSS
ncbi:Fanconi anemia group G protein isoform X2 [Lepisosteus oculatus]|uniref:Fanconi anemia group G protein isoform X2 n=1 Tax=Lepisosteus oculatus TaxID=7918 RepID=UPI0037203A32